MANEIERVRHSLCAATTTSVVAAECVFEGDSLVERYVLLRVSFGENAVEVRVEFTADFDTCAITSVRWTYEFTKDKLTALDYRRAKHLLAELLLGNWRERLHFIGRLPFRMKGEMDCLRKMLETAVTVL